MRASVLIAALSLLAGLKWPTAQRACIRPSFLPAALRTGPRPSFLPTALLWHTALLWPTALVPARGPHMLLGRSKLPINFMTKLGQANDDVTPCRFAMETFCGIENGEPERTATKDADTSILRLATLRFAILIATI